MGHLPAVKKTLKSIYESDRVFIRILEKAVDKAGNGRIKKSVSQLLKDAKNNLALIEPHLR